MRALINVTDAADAADIVTDADDTADAATDTVTDFHLIIPARYGATRLPGKALADIGGKPMVARVVEAALASAAVSVTVATDDSRIAEAAEAAGATAVMTGDHASGSDRVAEAAGVIGLANDAVVVNLQGDEPAMPAAVIDGVAALLARTPSASIATASAPLDDAQLNDSSVVKVVTGDADRALYFSRGGIKGARRHLGIYAYRAGYLKKFASRPPCAPERAEKLEQLRALWHGDAVVVFAADAAPTGVDTAADLERARRR